MFTKQEIRKKRIRIQLLIISYLSFLITITSPIIPLHSPNLQQAEAKSAFDPRDYAQAYAFNRYGWDDKEFTCLNRLWGKESAWNHLADNPRSSAFGIAQMLGEESKDPVTQIHNGLRYIEHRYTVPCNAWLFWTINRWY